MNTMAGRAEDACADAGAAGCREHPASGRKSSKAASLYMRDLRERIVSPSGKKYTRTAQGEPSLSRHRGKARKQQRIARKENYSAASRTVQFLAHMLEPALCRCYPMMVGVRRIIPNVLLMPALQFRHPVAVYIHMKPNNLAQNPERLGFPWSHSFILRAFLSPHLNFWQPRPQQPRHEVLHSICYAIKSHLEGAQNMEAGNETAAAILVQTI